MMRIIKQSSLIYPYLRNNELDETCCLKIEPKYDKIELDQTMSTCDGLSNNQ